MFNAPRMSDVFPKSNLLSSTVAIETPLIAKSCWPPVGALCQKEPNSNPNQ